MPGIKPIPVFLALLLAGCATSVATQHAERIDATSVTTAENSYKAMMDKLTPSRQRELALAVLAINLRGVNSAYEVVSNAGLQSLSIGRIKDEVKGMFADEIIALAIRKATVEFESPARE